MKRIQRGVFPAGSYIIVTEPLPPALQERLSPKGRMFYDSKWFLWALPYHFLDWIS